MKSDSSALSSPVALVLTTVGTTTQGTAIAHALVQERLAACVNVLPAMRSIYQWKGIVHDDAEHQLVIKTTVARVPEVFARIRALHGYELPELLVLSAEGASSYLDWVGTSVA